MAVNFTRVGSEVQVNKTTFNDQMDPDVAAATDGRFFVAWTSNYSDADDLDIFGQFHNPDGTRSGVEVLIDNDGNSGLGNDQDTPAVASRAGGGIVVVYRDTDLDGSGSANISLRTISSNGAVSSLLTVDNDGAQLSAPDVATLANGESLVVWQQNASGTDHDILGRFLDSAGTGFVTPGVRLVDNSAGSVSDNPAVAASGNNALIVYEDTRGGGNIDIRAAFYNGGTNEFPTPGTLIADAGGSLINPDVAALTDGRYVVVWDNSANNDIEGRFVDANGKPIGATFTIADNAGANDGPRVAALAGGGFLVTWDNDGGVIAPENGTDFAVLARRFDGTGAPAGDLFLVNTGDPNTSQFYPAVAINSATGRAFIAWQDNHSYSGAGQDNDPSGVRGRAFLATTDAVNGTAGIDTISTYGLGETIRGLEGDDTVNAKGGNDSADGGLGNDVLTGGSGGDSFRFTTKLDKKSNVDTITDFSAADDTIVLDNAIFKKLKTEGALKGKFFFEGKKAHDGNDAIVYNDRNGNLLYDKNGEKKGGAVLFARLEGSPDDVSAADFLVI